MNYKEEIKKVEEHIRLLINHQEDLYLKTDEKELEYIHIIRLRKLYKILEILGE